MTDGIEVVASNAIKHFAPVLHNEAIRIFTPFTNPVSLAACRPSPALKRFLIDYEPKVETDGLFPHQANFFKTYAQTDKRNFIITTATGSGKSLCFWSWVLDRLNQSTDATAILCFPTQALMWGQAERLARISDDAGLAKPDGQTTYGGRLGYDRQSIGWTIWHGKGSGETYDHVMAEHENTEAFRTARIRIATLDKAHWSLLRDHENKEFARRLDCLVLDEAHSYDGVFGANVHYFLKRLYLASEIRGQRRPGVFLASATLSHARDFGATLLSLDNANDIVHIEDSTKQRIDLVPTADVPKLLSKPPSDGLLRLCLLLNAENEDVRLLPFMGSDKLVGLDVNAIYFSQSKFVSKRLKLELEGRGGDRTYVVYDADLPPQQRREIEGRLNEGGVSGTTVLATSALELGVDIEGLDACFIDQIPPSHADLLQRIGRVGRRANRPGLVLLLLSAEPCDQRILENPCDAFRLDQSRPLPIPLHLDRLRWKHALAAYSEWASELQLGEVHQGDFSRALSHCFGESRSEFDLKRLYADRYGSLVNTRSRAWVHQGFRASASNGKIPLKEGEREVARIEDIAIFRDAHPEAVYLGHDSNRYRVVDYRVDWDIATWEHEQSDVLLGKWLPAVKAIMVAREPKQVATRGSWDESFKRYAIKRFADDSGCPKQGSLEFGVWDFVRTWQGYTEIDLRTQRKRKVPRAEVMRRFGEALERGERFPFLHDFSYRTEGWEWDFGTIARFRQDADWQKQLGNLAASILEHFLAEVVESAVADLGVRMDLPDHRLQVLDSTPGGNGLSQTLLTEGRLSSALRNCIRTLSRYRGQEDSKLFDRYVLTLCHEKPSHSVEEVLHVFEELHKRWSG